MNEVRRLRGRDAHRSGHAAEWRAAALLMLKGYRILGFRLATRQGEIDLLALRGKVLAVVEVKHRANLDDALECVSHEQRARLRRAGQVIAAQRPGLRDSLVRLDLIAMAPGRWPRHIPDAWTTDARFE